jgi:hypothetical protein
LKPEVGAKKEVFPPTSDFFLQDSPLTNAIARFSDIMSGSITIIKPQLGATNGSLSNLELSLAVGVIVGSD